MATFQTPTATLTVGGQTFEVISWENVQPSYFHAARLKAEVPTWQSGSSLDWWIDIGGSGDVVPVTLTVSGASEPLFDGILLEKNSKEGDGLTEIDAVDRTQLLINYKLYEAFQNKSGASVIETLAGKVGMTAKVSGLGGKVGALYTKDHIKISQGDFSRCSTAWDLISQIARENGLVAFVKGTVVYVQQDNPDAQNKWTLIYNPPTVNGNAVVYSQTSNVFSLELDHNLLCAKDISVTVRGFHSKKGEYHTHTVTNSAHVGAQRSSNNLNQNQYVVGPFPNWSKDKIIAYANELYKSLTAHEYTLKFEAAADFTITPYSKVTCTGGSAALNALPFFVNEITFKASLKEGATMDVVCKTLQPENDAQV